MPDRGDQEEVSHGHQRHVRNSAKSIHIAISFSFVQEKSLWLFQLPQTSVIKGTSDGRAIESLPDLCMLSKKVADAGILWALTYVSFALLRKFKCWSKLLIQKNVQ